MSPPADPDVPSGNGPSGPAAAVTPEDAERAGARWQALAAAFHEHLARDPNLCVMLGIDARLGELPDPTRRAEEEDLSGARDLLHELDVLDVSALSPDDALDVRLARLTLQAQVHDLTRLLDGRPEGDQKPTAGDDIGDGLFLQFVNDPRPDRERLATIVQRLERVPAYLADALARLDRPVARWVDIDREKVEALPQLLDTLEAWSEEVGAGGLGPAGLRARAALADHARHLAALPTSDALHLDEQDARELVRLRGIDLELEQLHALARDFLAETADTLETLRGRLVEKHGLPAQTTAAELTRELAQRFRVTLPSGRLEDVLARYRSEHERILEFIAERQLFPFPPDHDLRLLRTPGFMAPSIPAGAMMEPPPFRPGTRTSLVYLTLSEELLDEHTELSIPGMMIHEGIPGHHLQLAWAAEHPSLVRRHFQGMHHAEGWTTMLEDYMLDMGYMGELTDEARFVGKRDISRIGARVAIDLFFMTGERSFLDVGVPCDLSPADPFEAAGKLLEAVTGFVPGRVQAELNWYSQERGYPLSYLTGNHLVWQLKRDVEAASGLSGLELDRRFHDLYLRSGNMPLPFLREVFAREGLLG